MQVVKLLKSEAGSCINQCIGLGYINLFLLCAVIKKSEARQRATSDPSSGLQNPWFPTTDTARYGHYRLPNLPELLHRPRETQGPPDSW